MFTAQKRSATDGCGKTIMCSYKLCKVEFKYWGMQSKIERFIHDIGNVDHVIATDFKNYQVKYCWQTL